MKIKQLLVLLVLLVLVIQLRSNQHEMYRDLPMVTDVDVRNRLEFVPVFK